MPTIFDILEDMDDDSRELAEFLDQFTGMFVHPKYDIRCGDKVSWKKKMEDGTEKQMYSLIFYMHETYMFMLVNFMDENLGEWAPEDERVDMLSEVGVWNLSLIFAEGYDADEEGDIEYEDDEEFDDDEEED